MAEPLDLAPIRERSERWERKRSRLDRRALLAEVDRLAVILSDEDRMPVHVQAFATREDRYEIARWVRAVLAGDLDPESR